MPLMGPLVITTLREYYDNPFDRYTAISYVWGDPLPTDKLVIGEDYDALGVASNLAVALRSIRHPSQVLTLWVDAICINQADLTERAHQVGLMGSIYYWARFTIIYLGPPKPGVEVLFEAVHADNFRRLGVRKDRPSTEAGESNDMDQAANQQSFGDMTIPKEDSHQALVNAIESFCSYTWFGRSWVFQELLLSSDPCVQCGHMRAPWVELLRLVFNARLSAQGRELATVSKLPLAMNGKFEARAFGNQTMLDLIRVRTGSYATDPRDYFFSLMSLASDQQEVQSHLKIDYRQSVRDVYVAAATYVLDTIGLHQYLHTHLACSSQSAPKSPFRAALPDWVSDWSLKTPWIPDVSNRAEIPGSEDSSLPFPHAMVFKGRLTLPMIGATTTSTGCIEQISSILPRKPNPLSAETGYYTDDSDMAIYHFWHEWIYPLISDMADEARGPWSTRHTPEYHATAAEWYLLYAEHATSLENRGYRLARIRNDESMSIIHVVPASAAVGDTIFAGIELLDSVRFFKESYDRVSIMNGDLVATCCIVGRPLHFDDKEDDAMISKHMADVCRSKLQDGLGYISNGDLVRCFNEIQHFEFLGFSQAPTSSPEWHLGVYTTVSGVAVIH
ncbi:hypothetical protein PG984_015406 [Apiospora sp. TS-2023a]